MEHKYLDAQSYLEKHGKRLTSAAIGGMSIRIRGGDYSDLQGRHDYREIMPYFMYADDLINKGEIFFIYPFKCKCGNYRFQYGGGWACNTCGNCIQPPEWWKIRVCKDGDAWVCVGDGFEDLQSSSNYAYGDTRQQAIDNYYDLLNAK